MHIIDKKLLKKTSDFVSNLLQDKLPEIYVYHTIHHAKYVVSAIKTIGSAEGLSENDINIVILAGWFHDTGHIISYAHHEEESSKIAREFLANENVDEEIIAQVVGCIMATRIPQMPKNKLEEVICDADLCHIADADYYTYADLMREEKKSIEHMKISRKDFDKVSVIFFNQHVFFTNYGKTILQEGKDKNYKMITEHVESKGKKPDKNVKALNKEIERLQRQLSKKKGYSRGVESMFRLTARNQINLSSIADNKSNILITVNTVIISIVLTVLISRFAESPQLIIPSFVFLAVSLITIIFAILSTRPQVSSGVFSKEDIKKKSVNLLFFGNFYNMDYDEYDWAIKEMMKDDYYLYATMIKDQYNLGIVLARKYKLLRKAYNFFMFGLVITIIVFVLSFLNF